MRVHAQGQPWARLKPQFEGAKLPPIKDPRSWHPTASYRIDGAFETATGAEYALELWVFTDEDDQVTWIRTSLFIEPGCQLSAVPAELGYGPKTAVGRALELPRVQDIAKAYPVSTQIRLEYSPLGDRWAAFNPFMLWVYLELETAPGGPTGGTYLSVGFPSELDAPIAWSGRRQLPRPGWQRSDALGEPRFQQGNWWSGGDSPDAQAFMDEEVRRAAEWEAGTAKPR